MSIYVQVKLEDLIKLVSEKTESKQSIQEQENSVESGYKEIEKRFNPWLVDSQTPEICLIAVKKNGRSLKYVKNQTEDICLEAVKQDGMVLKYVENQNEQICLEAVKQNGYALQYVKDQTFEICLTAVRREPFALRYVKDQNFTICHEAVEQNFGASYLIRNKTVRENVMKSCRLN